MNLLLTKVALLVLLVLSSFLLFIKYYTNNAASLRSIEKNTTTIVKQGYIKKDTITLRHECNKTLDRRYKTIASEIEDYIRSREIVKKEELKIKDINISAIKKSTFFREKKIEENISKRAVKIKKDKKADSLPKVVIIMDDICSKFQAKMIKEIPIKITPSIFPASCDHPDTPQIAKEFSSYMVHTPMEAYHYLSPEEDTLNTGDSKELIERRIKKIKEDFPNLSAINNHTGSMFTSDIDSMRDLFSVLKKYGINFVDSKTSAETKAKLVAKEYRLKIYERNIFLDNIDDVDAILQRIKESVEYAKNHHLAIAICHPKESTFKALLRAKKLFDAVEVVYIDELYE